MSDYNSFSPRERYQFPDVSSGYQPYGSEQQNPTQGNYGEGGAENSDERNGLQGSTDTNRPYRFYKNIKLPRRETKGSRKERKSRENEDPMTQSHGSNFQNQDDQVAGYQGVATEFEPGYGSSITRDQPRDANDRFGAQSSDDDIISKFDGLNNMIKTWSISVATSTSISLKSAKPQTLDQFSKVTPNGGRNMENLERLLDDEWSKRLFIQGWVGLVLSEEVFLRFAEGGWPESNGLDFWMGEDNANAIQTIERAYLSADRKAVPLRQVNDWRAESVAVFARIEPDSSKRKMKSKTEGFRFSERKQKEITDQMMHVVKPEPDKRESTKAELRKIIKEAVEVSRLLRCQRPCWSIYYPKPSSEAGTAIALMDLSTMTEIGSTNGKVGDLDDTWSSLSSEQHSGPNDKLLELFVSPALFKTGNTDGELWEAGSSCLCKAVVTCKALDSSEASGNYPTHWQQRHAKSFTVDP